jgi:hypothetical protein
MKIVPRSLASFFVACLTLCPPSEAQKGEQAFEEIDIEASCNTAFEQQKSDKVADSTPFVMLMEQGSLTHDCQIVSFFATNLPSWREPDNKPIYIARRWYLRVTSQPQSTFAAGEDCDGMSAAVAVLAEFRAPAISVPGLTPLSDPMIIVADGSSFAFWSNRLLNGERRTDHGDVTLTASNNGAMGELNARIEDALLNCWQSAEHKATPR